MTLSSATKLATGHIGLNVTDLERSLAFYGKVFDFQVMAEGKESDRRWAFLGHDNQLLVTLWQQSEGTFSPETPGLHHLSFQVDSIEDVNTKAEILRGLGAEFTYDGVVPHGENGTSGGIFFADPDGTRLEIYAPSGADPAAAPVAGAPTCGFF
ncbi:VOC family protein [Amycolatopsis sp. DSM 110486]|uniref:VOC family protein n=1 Tax=Amycolatopsis sp. DSM 110486 TaxID=2865832 RepID=UPI001C6A51B8|nr:VOC family protein [Amycolatopsis sp. DSM 110486]QYN18789.1 VOC family protein [Amycolatopsis sp. DSM 110486]